MHHDTEIAHTLLDTHIDSSFDIMIVGGGIAGLSMALSLRLSGLNHSILLIDPNHEVDRETALADTRTSALMYGSIEFLKKIGVWDDLNDHVAPLQFLRILNHDDNPAQGGIMFKASDIDLPAFGWNIPNAFLQHCLLQRLKSLGNVTLLHGYHVHDFKDGNVCVQDAAGHSKFDLKADLYIACDGRASKMREFTHLRMAKNDTGQHAITLQFAHEFDHDDISTEIHYAGGPFTTVPLKGKMSSLVWVEESTRVQHIMDMSIEDIAALLQAKTKDLLGKVEIIGPVKSWPLVSYATSSLYNNNILLIAEAAHALHPMGAQGLNLSLRDVQSLTDHLVRGRRLGLPVNAASIINSYTQERMNDIRSRRFSTDMLNRYSRLQSGLTGAIAKNIKQVGFRILGQNQLVRNHLMTLGTGHTMLPSVKRKRFL